MKMYYHNRGLHWAIGIEGSKSEIESQFDSFFNHGAIDQTADLQWMSESFAYIWTTQEKVKKYFSNASYHEVLNDIETVGAWPSEGLRFGAMVVRKIRERAKERYNEMTNENFLPMNDAYTVPWTLGVIAAEKPDTN